MARADEGLKSEALRAALQEALAGRDARLQELLARHGWLPSGRPNLALAAAFGTELASLPGSVGPLLDPLAREDAAPDSPRAFLPVAAAHGWSARVREQREVGPAWAALMELAADERAPVRAGTLDALVGLGVRAGMSEELVARASEWLDADDRELRFGATSLAVEALGEARVIAALRDPEPLLAYLSRAIDEVAQAPRAAERSDARRRVLLALPRSLAAVVSGVRAGERGLAWLTSECQRAEHPDVRRALSLTIDALRTSARAQGQAVIETLRKALEQSAKPLRDPTRVRPGAGRGRQSRRTR